MEMLGVLLSQRKTRGQISIEMIIIVAVLLALVLVVATKLQQSASKGAQQISGEEEELEKILKATSCKDDSECTSIGYSYCNMTTGICEK
jgi:uncharacterized protein (UPF0333 family)